MSTHVIPSFSIPKYLQEIINLYTLYSDINCSSENLAINLKQINESKYNIKLPQNRCGNCYKCSREYIHFYLLGLYNFNEKYYDHCLDILKKTLKKQHPELKTINNKIAYEYYIKLPYQEVDLNEFIYG